MQREIAADERKRAIESDQAKSKAGGSVMDTFTREDMVDAVAEAISDSLDVDWNCRSGAEAVVRDCGLFELFEAAQTVFDGLNERIDSAPRNCVPVFAGIADLHAALNKVRG